MVNAYTKFQKASLYDFEDMLSTMSVGGIENDGRSNRMLYIPGYFIAHGIVIF